MSDLIERLREISVSDPLDYPDHTNPTALEAIAALTPVDDAEVRTAIHDIAMSSGLAGGTRDAWIALIERLAREKADINYLWSECNKQRASLQADLDAHRAALRDAREIAANFIEEIYECENNPDFKGHSVCTREEYRATIERVQEGK